MKKKYFFIGIISLIIFGFLIPQPIQALLVYTPLNSFFNNHLVILCIIVGIIQAISEECGYYSVMKKIYTKDHSDCLSKWFGLGRGVLHTIFDIASAMILITSFGNGFLIVISRLISLVALVQLTYLDFISLKEKNIRFLIVSIIFHFAMNSILYANELKLLNFSDSSFVLIYSCTVIAVSNVLIKKCNFKGVIL